MTKFLTAALLFLAVSPTAAATPAAEAIRKAVEEVGGKVVFSQNGEPVEIDLYNSSNPLKGRGSRNTAVNDAWLKNLSGCTTLTSLNLANCDVHGPGLKHLAGLSKLEILNLTLTPLADDGLEHLAGLMELKSLGLASTECTGIGFKHLRGLKKLMNVNLHHTPANDAGLAAIAELPNLERLWVVHAGFTDAAAASLAAHKNLKRLGIGSSLKENSSGEALSRIGGLPLTELEIYDKQTTDEAIGYVAGIPTLRLLSISNSSEITDATVESLLKLPALEELKIGPTKLTDAGLARLAGLKTLKKLALSIPKKSRTPVVTNAGVESLKQARPDLTVEVK